MELVRTTEKLLPAKVAPIALVDLLIIRWSLSKNLT